MRRKITILFNRQFQLIKPFIIEKRFAIVFGLTSLLIVDLLQLFIPRIIKWAIDDITALSATDKDLFQYGLLILSCALAIGLFRFFWRFCIMGMARRVEEGIRATLFSHIQRLPASFFDKTTAGDIMAHATNDITNIRMALGMGLVALTDTLVIGTCAVFFMGYISVKLTLMALAPMPFIALLTKILSKKLFHAYRGVQETFSQLMEASRERFAGIKVIKAYNRETAEAEQIESESKVYISSNMHLVKLRGLIFPMIIFFTNISLAIVLAAGGSQVIYGDISPGDFVAFIAYLNLLTWPVMAIGWVSNLLQRGKASIDRINHLLWIPREIKDPERPAQLESTKEALCLKNISFSYDKTHSNPPVLNGVSFTVKPGEITGITGPPGSGKTTLAMLIPRLYDPDSGRISIGGIDTKQIGVETLRKSIAFLPQEPFLFSGSIRDNLVFGNPEADETAIERVIAQAQLTNTLRAFPSGIDTIIGEKGVTLSGGQKQRIALARALLKQAPILILDDPISQVDMRTAASIVAVIESLAYLRTIIVISHRFSVFKNAARIIVLENGQTTASGTHSSLIQKSGYYSKTWRMQTNEKYLSGGMP